MSRTYHGTTAHYNGYFNANDLLDEALKNYRTNLKENFYENLPIQALPNNEEVKNMYTPIDTAIGKCKKVISKHAMPTMDKPSQKKAEWNNWIDENWLTIAKANYYRRNYDVAIKNFDFTRKFFAGDRSAYIAEIWMIRAFVQEKRFTEALLTIQNLENQKLEAEEEGHKKEKLTKKQKQNGEKAELPFPKKLYYDFAVSKALYYEAKKEIDEEIKALEEAVKLGKKKKEKARLYYVLGQLYETKGDKQNAGKNFEKVLACSPNFEMAFNAQLKAALNSGGIKLEKKLNKMLLDPKNIEYKDQVYYTLGLIAESSGNESLAKQQFTNSALYSLTNKRQKGMAYEKLGNMSFAQKDYVKAQKYYDSCATTIPEDYPNFEGIKNKATQLEDLVKYIETAQYEDSVQKVASLPESERIAFIEKVIKAEKEKAAEQKKRDAERLKFLQEQQAKAKDNNNNEGIGGSKWYWNNQKAKQEGFDEFKRQWGQRVNEDDWRRSEKIVFANDIEMNDKDSSDIVLEDEVEVDSMTVESLLAKLPSSDSALAVSRARLMEALYMSGLIYNEELKEPALAEKQFLTVLEKNFEDPHKVQSAFQIYRMNEVSSVKANTQKDYILLYYPTSDYAGFLRDPDYFIKKKEREKETLNEYLRYLEKFENGQYSVVTAKANSVIETEKENPYRAKYYLLKIKAEAKQTEDKKSLLPTINTLITEYPDSDEAKSAKKMKDIIEKGYSRNEVVDFTKNNVYTYDENSKMYAIVFLNEKVNTSIAKTRVSDFNKEYFGKQRLNTSATMLDKTSIILLKEFEDISTAQDYKATFKRTKKHLNDMRNFKVIIISPENFKILFESNKLSEYEVFADENY